MLYFGSFNPIHKGHIALAEYAIEKGLCDEVVLVVSPQNPLKPAGQQAPELDRFSMAETACAASKYPDKIKPSVIEFMLDKPSYTIHILRHLTENYGTQMRFSILMGDDLVPQLPEWKQYREIIDNYPIFVYPRTGQPLPDLGGRITLLEDAPLYPYSSSEIRERLGRGEDVGNMLPEGVMRYITRDRFTIHHFCRTDIRNVGESGQYAFSVQVAKPSFDIVFCEKLGINDTCFPA